MDISDETKQIHMQILMLFYNVLQDMESFREIVSEFCRMV